MRLLYRMTASGICLLALIFLAQFSQAQDNPNLDTPLLRAGHFVSPTGTNSINVITTSDGFDNFDLGSTFAEPHDVSNPLSPLQFFTAYNTNTSFHSENGIAWATNNPAFPNAAGDPVAAYDSLGNLYYENMKNPITGCWVVKSTNNGLTWGTAVTSIAGNDKNWIACDQTMGPYANYVYTTMTNNGVGGFARSTDLGATFTTTFAPSTQSLPGMMVAVGPDVMNGNNISGGCVYVVTHSGTNAAGIYTFYRSKDGGATFAQVSSTQFSNIIGTEISSRSSVSGMRTRPYPMIAADNSYGTYRGRLYLVYASNSPAGSGNKSDVFLRYSTDQGFTWSSPTVVHDDPNTANNFQFFPAIWADKQTGRLYIKWYDTRRVPSSDSMDVYATYTDDGGQTFAPNQRLSNRFFQISCTTCGGGGTPRYQGDYDAITSNPISSLAVWTDFRNGTFLGVAAYFPDFALLTSAKRDTLKFTDSTTAVIKIPAVKLYTNRVKFTATVTPAAPFVFTWQGRDSLTTYPDSLILKIKTNSVPEGNYTVTIIGQGPNGTPVHQRTFPLRVQYIPNTVTVLQPNGREIWVQGQTKQIRWRNRGDVNNVRIENSTNNGTSWTTISASVPAENGFVNWTIPATPSTQSRVRVAWLDSVNTIRDLSDTTFTISAPTPLVSSSNDTLRATLLLGNNTGVDTLRMSNSGTLALAWNSAGTAWANASPATGSIPVDSTRRIPVQFNGTGLTGGTYRGDLTITSNDSYHSPLPVPMRLTVVGIPFATGTRDSLNFGAVRFGTTDSIKFALRNSGTDTLRGTASITPVGRFVVAPSAIKVAANDSLQLTVRFTPLDSTTSSNATLRIITNDPNPNRDTLFVRLTGMGRGTASVQLTAQNLIPSHYSLDQNYPNPFNPTTNIRFGIPSGLSNSEATTLKVFDVLGRDVATLVNEKLAPGVYTARFETSGIASGIYFYKLNAGKFGKTKKMMLTK